MRKKLYQIWLAKLELLSEYLKTKDIICEIAKSNEFTFRQNAIDVINALQNSGIPIIVNSSGIGELVQELLLYNGCNINNLKIYSNYIFNPRGYIITPDNKYVCEYEYEINKAYQRIIIGDTLGDLTMITNKRKEDISIGFLDGEYSTYLKQFNDNFDIVAIDNSSYDAPLRKAKVLY